MSTKGLQARACRLFNAQLFIHCCQEDELFDVEGVMGLLCGSFNFYSSHVYKVYSRVYRV
jgi:hypothetical protein